MANQKPLYLIGFPYQSTQFTAIRALFLHPDCPWRPAAIVHDQVYADTVDDIAVMRSADFVQHAAQTPCTAMLLCADETVCDLWRREIRRLGITLIDEGELVLEMAAILAAQGASHDQHGLLLPGALADKNSAQPLERWRETHWREGKTRPALVLAAWEHYLRTGLRARLDALVPHNGLVRWRDRFRAAFAQPSTAGGAVFDITRAQQGFLANHENAFLGEALFWCGCQQWQFVLASDDDAWLQTRQAHFDTAWGGLGLAPQCVAWPQHEHTPPALSAALQASCKLVRLDVDAPLPWVQKLRATSRHSVFFIRVGRNAQQLPDLLTAFGSECAYLDCDRPNSHGLLLTLVFAD